MLLSVTSATIGEFLSYSRFRWEHLPSAPHQTTALRTVQCVRVLADANHVSDLVTAVYEDTDRAITRIEQLPQDKRLSQLLLIALEREQVVSVAYSEEMVASKIARLTVDHETRDLVSRILLWVHRDEALHAQYIRGVLLRTANGTPSRVTLSRQVVGAVGGWASAVSQRGSEDFLGLRFMAARTLLWLGMVSGQIPRCVYSELRFHGFKRFCEFNLALERSAILSYERIVPLLGIEEQAAFHRILADEVRHAAVFQVLFESLDETDQLVPGVTAQSLRERVGAISGWFLPAHHRAGQPQSVLGRGSTVHCGRGTDGQLGKLVEETLERSGLRSLVEDHPGTVAIKTSFMFGYDRADQSNIVAPEFMKHVAVLLRKWGANDVAFLEAPNIYDRYFHNRSVHDVADYFGYKSAHYRIVDTEADGVQNDFARGLACTSISRTWRDADLRIVLSKLRGDPAEMAKLGTTTLAGITGRVDDQVYTDRLVDFRTSTLMALDVAPPHFSIVDAWGAVADGPIGVMGCNRPARCDRIYAGADVLSVDAVVLADLGCENPFVSPFVRQTDQWFGCSAGPTLVSGDAGPITNFRLPQKTVWHRLISATAAPVYFHLSRNGERFTPAMDQTAFPPSRPPSLTTRAVRKLAQRTFGLRPPKGDQ